jgi:hypothetical protein
MARKLDWFPFYAAAFQTDEAVRLMDVSQVGVYLLLLCHQWINGSIPADESQALALLQPQLSPLADDNTFRLASEVLERCFPPSNDDPTRRQNRRLEVVRAEQAATRERLSEAGRKGGRPKGGVSRTEKPGFSNTAKPGFAIDKEKRRVERKEKLTTSSADAADQAFEAAWRAYPRRPNNPKAKALKAWRARIREGVDPAALVAGVRAYAAYVRRESKAPEFVKLGATFFGPDRHWESDYGAPLEGEQPDGTIRVYGEGGGPTPAFLHAMGLAQ